MKEYIEKILTVVGVLLIFSGLISGIYSFSKIDSKAYENAKEIFDKLPDNDFAEAAYNTTHQIYISEITYAVTVLFGGIITGLLFIGFARVIELLKEKNERDYNLQKIFNKIDNKLGEIKEDNVKI